MEKDHDQELQDTESLKAAIEHKIEELIQASAALSLLHRNTCQTLVLIFQTGHHKLASQLDRASTYYLNDPTQLHSCVSPALVLLLKCLQDALHFIKMLASCEQEMDLQHTPLHTWPLMRALMVGLNTDAVDVHLHDFLLAYYSVTEAILFSLEKKPDVSVVLEQTWRRADQLQLRQRAMFWSMDRGRPHVFTLTDDLVLDRQRKRDLELLRKGLEQRLIETEASSSSSSNSANTNDRKVAEFLKRKLSLMKNEITITSGGNVSSSGFLNLSFDGDMVDVETLYHIDQLTVKEVKWQGATYALKQYEAYEASEGDLFQSEASEGDLLPEFTQEVQIHENLHNPNVIQVICTLQDEKKGGLLMELMDGTLDDLTLPLKPKYAHLVGSGEFEQLTLSEKVRVMLQIAKAMEYIHSKGLIHRDLKPANILVKKGPISSQVLPQSACANRSRTFEIKVADFGISKVNFFPFQTHTSKTGTGLFRAPEVLNEERYTFPADVYSFAMVCFQIVSGKIPFKATRATTQKIIREKLRPDLRSLSDDQCPPYLKHCLEAWWHAEPQRRGCFPEICRTLRHLTAALHKCQDPIRELPFLRLPQWLWNAARDRANAGFFHWEDLQSLWKEELGYPSAYSKVNDIPYELRVMKMLVEPWPYQDGFFLLDGSQISLKSVTLRTYITALEGGGGKLIARARIADIWERFKIMQHGDTGFSLQTYGGPFVSAVSGGGGIVTASVHDNSGPSERFYFTRSEDGKRVHIRANNGQYLQAKDDINEVTADYVSSSEPSWGENAATFEMEYRVCGNMTNNRMKPIIEDWSKPAVGLVLRAPAGLHLHDGDRVFLKSVTLGTFVYSHLGGPVKMQRNGSLVMIRLHKNEICSIRSDSSEYFSAPIKAGGNVTATENYPGEWARFYITQDGRRVHIQSVYTGMYLQATGDYLVVGDYLVDGSKSMPGWDNNAATFEVF